MKNKENNPNNLTPKQVITVIALFIGIPMLLGIFASTSEISDTQGILFTENGAELISSSDFEVIESTGERSSDGIYTIKGKIKQNKESSYTGLMLTFTLYDINNKKVRETTTSFSNYLGNNIWEFSAIGNDADGIVTSYKLDTAHGF